MGTGALLEPRESWGCPAGLMDRSCGHERRNEVPANYSLAVRKWGKEIPWYLSSPCLLTLLGPPAGHSQSKARGRGSQEMHLAELSLLGTQKDGGEWRVDLEG